MKTYFTITIAVPASERVKLRSLSEFSKLLLRRFNSGQSYLITTNGKQRITAPCFGSVYKVHYTKCTVNICAIPYHAYHAVM